jgi:hypothetical protein
MQLGASRCTGSGSSSGFSARTKLPPQPTLSPPPNVTAGSDTCRRGLAPSVVQRRKERLAPLGRRSSRIGSPGLMAHDRAGRRCRLRPHLGCRARLDGPCTFALGHLETPLHRVGAIARRHHANPAEAHWRWRGRGASRSGSASVTTMHAPFEGEVERKMTSGSTGFYVAHLGVEQPYRDAVRSSLRATSVENHCRI